MREHGAGGDGMADDAPAIQGTIDSARSGDTVFLPRGDYRIGRPLRARSHVALKGEEGSRILYAGSAADALIRLNQATDVEISYLTLDGNRHDQANAGIRAMQGGRLRFHHLAIRNLTGVTYGPIGIHLVGTKAYDGPKDCTISDNRIANIGPKSAWGAGIRCSWGSSRNRILRNIIEGTGRGGILADNGSTDLAIRDNRISGSGKTAEALGIEVWGGCDRAVIENNRIDHWLSVAMSHHCAIRRNTIRDPDESVVAFIGMELASGGAGLTTDAVFTDNVVDRGQEIGISISGPASKDHVYWAYNTVEHMVNWALQMQGESGGARYHYFYRNRLNGTNRNDPRAKYKPGGNAFRFNGDCYHITLDGNRLEDNGGAGIQFSNRLDHISIVNNIIANNAGPAAIPVPAPIADLEWSANRVEGNAGNAEPASRGVAGRKPVARFTVSATKRTVAFRNKSEGNLAHVLWDLDDGPPVNLTNPTHTYTRAGTYRVSLIVWDTAGQGARTETKITVQ